MAITIREGECWIEIEVVDRVPARLPPPGDVELCVSIESNGFNGHGFAWVDGPTIASFLHQLTELEQCRQGSAQIEGMSPDVFRLRIFSVDRRGHMAIAGMVAKQIHKGDGGPHQHSLEFGFEFDPTLMPKILAGFVEIAKEPIPGA